MTRRGMLGIALGIGLIAWGTAQMKRGVSQIAGAQEQQPLTEGVTIPVSDAMGELAQAGNAGLRTLSGANSVRLIPVSRGQCRALAPAGWGVASVSERGDVGEFVSSDGRSYAGWGIRGVNRAMEPYYGAFYGDPMRSSLFLLGKIAEAMGDRSEFAPLGEPVRFGDEFVGQELQSQVNRALLVYRLYPAPGMFSPGSYIISLRTAIVLRNADAFALKSAAGVAGSISCNTLFVPTAANDVPLPRPGDPTDARRKREADQLADYNVQLGTQTFHSPTTGENFLVDRSSAITNGPQGEGVYRKIGNSVELLTPGRSQ